MNMIGQHIRYVHRHYDNDDKYVIEGEFEGTIMDRCFNHSNNYPNGNGSYYIVKRDNEKLTIDRVWITDLINFVTK